MNFIIAVIIEESKRVRDNLIINFYLALIRKELFS